MPQKRNPHKSERICGLARIVRSQLDPSLETISLEHERDLTNSSTERISLPTAACLTHYILMEMAKILTVLHIDEENVSRNLHAGGGAQVAERIMMALADKLGRQVNWIALIGIVRVKRFLSCCVSCRKHMKFCVCTRRALYLSTRCAAIRESLKFLAPLN